MSQYEMDMAAKDSARSSAECSTGSLPGAQSVNKNDDTAAAARLDERIAAKSQSAGLSSSSSSLKSPDKEEEEEEEEEEEGHADDGDVESNTGMNEAKAVPVSADDEKQNDKDDIMKDKKEEMSLYEAKDSRALPFAHLTQEQIAQGLDHAPAVQYGEMSEFGNTGGLVEAVQVEEDPEEAFLPAAEEYDPNSKLPPLFHNPKFRLCAIVTLVSVIVLTVGLSVGLTKSVYTEEELVNKTEVPTAMPTAMPTSYRDTIGIHQYLEPFYFAADSDSDTPSPQEMATDWIVNHDPMQLTQQNENIKQRWSLAVLAFATDSYNWNVCGKSPLPPQIQNPGDEEKQDIKCIVEELDISTGQFEQKEYSYWISSHHECSWFGVTCDAEDNVVLLNLPNNNLEGSFPAELTHLENLRVLALHSNKFTGALPTQIGLFSKSLNDLQLHNNEFVGHIPDELYELQLLQNLILAWNDFSGTLSTKIGLLENLKGLHLFNTMLDGQIPSEVGQLEFLNFLRTHNNAFTGSIPSEITKLTGLRELWNHQTLNTGVLPADIGNLVDLEILYVNDCRLSGPLPPSFYNLEKLQQFYAWDNRNLFEEPISPGFNGTISTDIGNMEELTSFIVKNNWFEGELPYEFGSLEKLDTVWFHFNDITGVSPFCDKDLPNIKRQQYTSLQMDCSDAIGIENTKVECNCCTQCCSRETRVCRDQQ